jgi:hypothetical protein
MTAPTENTPRINITVPPGGDRSPAAIAALLRSAFVRTLADEIGKRADRCITSGAVLSINELEEFVGKHLEAIKTQLADELGRRTGPGASLLASVASARDATIKTYLGGPAAPPAAAPPGVTVINQLPEYVEVQTEASYDDEGRVSGTKTIKAAVGARP